MLISGKFLSKIHLTLLSIIWKKSPLNPYSKNLRLRFLSPVKPRCPMPSEIELKQIDFQKRPSPTSCVPVVSIKDTFDFTVAVTQWQEALMFKIELNNLLSALHLPDTLMFLLSLAPHLLQLLKRARRINAESGTSSLRPISLQVRLLCSSQTTVNLGRGQLFHGQYQNISCCTILLSRPAEGWDFWFGMGFFSTQLGSWGQSLVLQRIDNHG